MPEQDHYAVLQLPRDATGAEIKRRYRQLMREVHPDANRRDPDATRKAARLNRAYETLGDAEKRRVYDAAHRVAASATGRRDPASAAVWRRMSDQKYSAWAVEPDWEDIVADHVPPKRPAHVHAPAPTIEPEEIEVSVAELREQPRVKRTITVTNHCDCTMKGDVSTSEPWLWGPIGTFELKPGATVSFDVEVISRKVAFPGLSRVLFVAKDWTGVVPVKVTGYEPKRRRVHPAADMPYVRPRRPKRTTYR
jgi:hypothetical protein